MFPCLCLRNSKINWVPIFFFWLFNNVRWKLKMHFFDREGKNICNFFFGCFGNTSLSNVSKQHKKNVLQQLLFCMYKAFFLFFLVFLDTVVQNFKITNHVSFLFLFICGKNHGQWPRYNTSNSDMHRNYFIPSWLHWLTTTKIK